MQTDGVSKIAPKSRTPRERFTNCLSLVSSFREQFEALCDPVNLRILSSVGEGWFGNSDVRALLDSHRQTSWVRLSRLTSAGLLEKRGHSYRMPKRAVDLVETVAGALAGLVSLEELSADSEFLEALKVASEGVDLLYGKGRLEQSEYAKVKATLDKAGTRHGLLAY